jgi:exodeoxyribonuclease V alpha subunit
MSASSATAAELNAERLEGSVERVTFYNPENGFSVLRLRPRGRREPVVVVGTLPAAQPGERLTLDGQWRIDPRHGAQFRAQHAEVFAPAALDDIERYLGSGLIRLIGPVLAGRIVATFGERTLEVLDTEPMRVREVPGVGRRRGESIASAWTEHRALRAISAFLAHHRLDTRYAPRLLAAYGTDAPRIVRANPYRLVGDVPGLGFSAADRLGRSLGVRAGAVPRLQAATLAALLRAAEQGHTRLTSSGLMSGAAALAGVEPQLIEPCVIQLRTGGLVSSGGERRSAAAAERVPLLPVSTTGRVRVYAPPAPSESELVEDDGVGLTHLVRAEEWLAKGLCRLARRAARASAAHVEAWLAADPDSRGLSDEQRLAVRTAALSGCFVLTGGPGVGKTTTLRVLVRCLESLGGSVALAAPTGKAAKRLGDVVGREARTVHRLLGAGPTGFQHGYELPLPFDAIIVDEASMLDTQLARAVVSAIGATSQLILVGDADQLPSVGPGQVLRDVLASGIVPAVQLQTVFRQAAQSQIVRHAHSIRAGEVPVLDAASALRAGVDCVFVPADADTLTDVASRWAADYLPRFLQVDPAEVQTLAPLTRVCQVLNGALQQRLNPAEDGRAERPHGALPLRVGDRVIQTRNNYTLEVFNGETGCVQALDPERAVIDFGDERVVEYSAIDLLDVEHAYCLTVHRSQGSEWPGVIVLVASDHRPMLTRNLLYTALTRARRVAVLIGDEAAIRTAIADTRDRVRTTGLVGLLRAQALDARSTSEA